MVLGVSSCRGRILSLFFLGVLVSFPALSDETVPLSICLLEDNMPYSGKVTSNGFDYDLGARLAERMGREFVPVWVSNSTQIQEIESDYPFRRLAKGECDVILSVPGTSESFEEGGKTIVLGPAYYAAAFELISFSEETSTNLRRLRSKNVAIQSQTVAHFALKMLGAKSKTYFSAADAISGVANGEADAGLLWGPTAGWLLRESDEQRPRGFVDNYEPPIALRWNVHFVTLSSNDILRGQVGDILVDIDASGELSGLMKKYNLPDRRPYAQTYTLGALNELQSAR
jgi:ABC-type amino acid transport substrate-binding protein